MSQLTDDMLRNRPDLTSREIEIAICLAGGATCDEIAIETHLGFETVRTHIKSLRVRTKLRRKAQLAVWAALNLNWLETQKLLKKEKHRVAHTSA